MSNTEFLSLVLFGAMATIGAFWDLRFRKIPNLLTAIMAVTGLAATTFEYGSARGVEGLAHLAIALAIGLFVYAVRMWGGGDAKFYAASAAWFQLADFPRLLFSISLAGVALLAVWFALRRLLRREAISGSKGELPYGVAIASGAIVTMIWQHIQ